MLFILDSARSWTMGLLPFVVIDPSLEVDERGWYIFRGHVTPPVFLPWREDINSLSHIACPDCGELLPNLSYQPRRGFSHSIRSKSESAASRQE